MTKVTRDYVLSHLHALKNDRGDLEGQHIEADALLLAYIDDPEITEVFQSIPKWYA